MSAASLPVQPGDYATISDDANALTWEVKAIHPAGDGSTEDLACLVSGRSGRRRFEPVSRLRFFCGPEGVGREGVGLE